jgi:hypothetical protein
MLDLRRCVRDLTGVLSTIVLVACGATSNKEQPCATSH